MKKFLGALVLVCATAGLASAADAVKGEWTGFITDTHCGARGATKDHTVACVEKCMKTGSKAQLWSEADKKTHDLDSFDKVKELVGTRVTVKGAMDPATGAITVESAAKAGAVAN